MGNIHYNLKSFGIRNVNCFKAFISFYFAVLSYEGKIKLSSREQKFLKKPVAYMRIFGEIGETGCFPVDFRCASDLKQVSFLFLVAN